MSIFYLYCFARAGIVHAGGIVHPDAVVDVIEAGECAAVVSQVFAPEIDAANFAEEQDPDRIIARALWHEQVVEQVMRYSPVLPVRYGAVFTSTQSLAKLLIGRADEIRRFLDVVTGKEEWGVKSFLDMSTAGAWLLAGAADFAQRRRSLPEARGARYFQEKKLRADVENQARSWADALAEQVEQELATRAVRSCPLRIQQRNATGRDLVRNAAFLVERGGAEIFRERLETLAEHYREQGLVLEITGPWPPYSFCPALERTSHEAPGVLHSA